MVTALRNSVCPSRQEEIPAEETRIQPRNGEADSTQININSVSTSQQQESHPHSQIPNEEADSGQTMRQQENNCQGEIHIPIHGQEDKSLTNDCVLPFEDKNNVLYKAAVEGDIKNALNLFGNDEKIYRSMLCRPITERCQTVLHIAAEAKQTHFVEWILKYVKQEDLELPDSNGNNAFCLATIVGAKPIAEMMLEKYRGLLKIPGGKDMTPLYLAALFGQSDMAAYLYEQYGEMEVVEKMEDIFYASILSNLYDLAIELLQRNEELAVVSYAGHGTALHMLAKNPSAFTSKGKNVINHGTDSSLKLLNCLWEKIKAVRGKNVTAYMDENKDMIFEAAKLGNSEFLKKLIHIYPDLVRRLDDDGRTIFHVALLNRHNAVFNLISILGDFDKHYVTTLTDIEGNNLLHLAGKYLNVPRPLSKVPGAALQMQQELKNFKMVESLIMPSYREMRNIDNLTPREVFTKEHKKLKKSGEEWMKKTAESSMLVATIIASVVFAAAFTVPGDYDNDGKPRHLKNIIFSSFTMADAITLSSASISILLFLAILTSCYEEDDFLTSLPLKLMVGLLTLLVSITTMMLSFSLNFFLSYSHVESSYLTVPFLICVFGFGPVILFVCLQRCLLYDILRSSFCTKAFAN